MVEKIPHDTDPETFQVWCDILRGLSPEQRLRNMVALYEQQRELTRTRLRLLHPQESGEQIEMRLRREQWGEELFRQVYPNYHD